MQTLKIAFAALEYWFTKVDLNVVLQSGRVMCRVGSVASLMLAASPATSSPPPPPPPVRGHQSNCDVTAYSNMPCLTEFKYLCININHFDQISGHGTDCLYFQTTEPREWSQLTKENPSG